MRETQLRWGLGTGLAGGVIGVLALVVGSVLEPLSSRNVGPEALAIMLFVRGVLVLISLGIALSLAYWAGMHVALDHAHLAATPAGALDRTQAALAGGIALLCYWLFTTIYIYAAALLGPRTPLLAFVESRLVFGAICVVLGAGLGGLGARAAGAHALLDRLVAASTARASAGASAESSAPSDPHDPSDLHGPAAAPRE